MDSYFLADYASSAVQPPGRFQVLSMKAQATPAGRLQAYFEIVLAQTADELRSADMDVIYALGELAGEELQASCGSIQLHCAGMLKFLGVWSSCCLWLCLMMMQGQSCIWHQTLLLNQASLTQAALRWPKSVLC